MSHAVFLRLEIAEVVGVGCHLDGDVLHDFQSVGLQSDALDGVVRQQAHLMDAEMTQHLGAAAVVALVGLEAEVAILFIRPMPLPSCCM